MAKKFKFRLEKVLELREQIREEKKKELFLKNTAVRETEEKITDLDKQLNTSGRTTGVIKAQELHLTAQYESRLLAEIDAARDVLALLVFEAERAKEEYLEAVKEHEALKMLKARKQLEYQNSADKEEAKVLDELAVQRYGRLDRE